MPFPRHIVEPKHVRQGLPPKPEGVRSTLHEYCNLTLTNFIRQLANLSGQVETIFESLITESEDFKRRLDDMRKRLDTIEEKAKKLDSLKEDVGKGFGKDKKAVYKAIADRARFFQSEQQLNTGLFMDTDQPTEVKDLREKAEPMPRLHELDKFRTDGKESAKIYSNPNLFFLAWQDSLQKMIAEQHANYNMTPRSTVRQTRLRRVKRAKASRIIEAQKYKMGAEFVPDERAALEEDEYFTDEEWSGSDEDELEKIQINGSMKHQTGNGNHFQATVEAGSSILPPPSTIKLPQLDTKSVSSSREYDFNDIDFLDPNDDLPSPPALPPLSLGLDSLKINGEIPPPTKITNNDYSGRSAEYSIQSTLDAVNSARWADDT